MTVALGSLAVSVIGLVITVGVGVWKLGKNHGELKTLITEHIRMCDSTRPGCQARMSSLENRDFELARNGNGGHS